jgi:hypothetical protein
MTVAAAEKQHSQQQQSFNFQSFSIHFQSIAVFPARCNNLPVFPMHFVAVFPMHFDRYYR